MVDIPADSSTGTDIAIGGSIIDRLEINGDRDWIRIELTADHLYLIELSGSGSDPLGDPYLSIRNSDGELIDHDDDSGSGLNSRLHFLPETTGTYYIDVGAYSNAYHGTYQLNVTEIDVSDDIPGNRSTTATIAVDETLVSQLEYAGDRDFIRVELTADHVYVIDLSGSGDDPLEYPYLQLRNSDGAAVGSGNFDPTSSHLEFRPATTGTYYIDVDDRFTGSVGTYQLSLGEIDVSEDIAGDASTTASIEVGESVAGQLEYMGDTDWFRIDLAEGQRIIITSSGTGDWPVLRDSSGAYLASPADISYGTAAQFAYMPTASGTYYIDVGALFDESTGIYELSVVQSDPITSSGNVDSVWGFNSSPDTAGYDPVARVDDLVYIADQGGVDTLDLSGFVQWQTIDLAPGATSSVGGGGRNLEIAAGTVIENAIGGSGSDSIYGNDANNLLRGNAGYDDLYGLGGDDILDGGAGADYMSGGDGNDTYYVDASGDWVSDWSGNDDVVYAAISYTLPYNIEQLVLTGAAMAGTGNSFANHIVGNARDNELAGLHGDDVLDGGAGDDVMRGGMGDDTFMVDSIGDRVIEALRAGIDTVISEVDFQLASGVESLTLTGNAIAGIGNRASNTIWGNALDNLLNGGGGTDIMRGGAGDDLYIVDHQRDRAAETAGEGVDSVLSSVSFVLRDNVENLSLRGDAVRAVGNIFDNALRGNSGDNVLDGRVGADVMRGGGGDDFYIIDNANDRVVEARGAGDDRVYARISYRAEANVEQVILRGSGAFDITGNGLDNALVGNVDANRINGGAGADTMRGGGGNDLFEFRDNSFAGLRPSTCDRIVDFSQDQGDSIDLHLVDADTATAGRQDFAFIGTGAFTGAAGQLRYEVINDNTYVYGDTNGDGAADFMIRLDGGHALVGGDFIL